MNSTIIDLSQRDGTVFENGDYSVRLAYQQTIYPGDEITLRNAYIDTVSNNLDRITLNQDAELTLTHGFYMLDWEGDTAKLNYNAKIPNKPSGVNYIVMMEKGIFEVVDVDFSRVPPDSGYTNTGGPVIFDYLDETNNPQTVTINVPEKPYRDDPSDYKFTFGTPLKVQQDSFQLSPKNTAEKLKSKDYLEVKTITINPVASDKRYDPLVVSSNINIAKGSYSPIEFAQLITDRLSENVGNFHNQKSNFGLNSPFLFVAEQFDDIASGINPLKLWLNEPINDPSTTDVTVDIPIITYNNTKMAVGTSQVALEYNTATDTFDWADIHLPGYDDAGDVVIGVKQIGSIVGTKGDYFSYNKNSGIYWVNATSQYADGSPLNIWEDILGFDSSVFGTISQEYTDKNALKFSYLETKLVDASNITGEYPGIDQFINKKSASNYNIIDPASTPLATSTDTVKIIAAKPFEDNDVSSAYFLVELRNTFKTETITSTDINGSLMGIVSKFYSYKSFTSADTSSSRSYVHLGEPTILTDVRVQIKDPNTKTIANTIGKDNSVFMEIRRNPHDNQNQGSQNNQNQGSQKKSK
jgi:hypothetical protein